MSFGSEVPDHTMSILLGLAFSVVEPLIAPIGLLYFLVMTLIGKYQMVYVFTDTFQSGGKVSETPRPRCCTLWLALPVTSLQQPTRGLSSSVNTKLPLMLHTRSCKHCDFTCSRWYSSTLLFVQGRIHEYNCVYRLHCTYQNLFAQFSRAVMGADMAASFRPNHCRSVDFPAADDWACRPKESSYTGGLLSPPPLHHSHLQVTTAVSLSCADVTLPQINARPYHA